MADDHLAGNVAAGPGVDAQPPTQTANTSAQRTGSSEARKTSMASSTTTTATTIPPLRKQLSATLLPQLPKSTGSSPHTSRNSSPNRKDTKITPQISTQPSAAAIQRALSAANAPQLPAGAVGDAVSRLPRQNKSASGSAENTPHWPLSPRLKSPPPSATNSRRGSATTMHKRPEGAVTPSVNVQSATPQTSTPPPPPSPQPVAEETSTSKQPPLQTPGKGPSRGPSGKSTLETVQENSVDDVKEPSPAARKAAADLRPLTKLSDEETVADKPEAVSAESERPPHSLESGSESGGAKSDGKKQRQPQQQSQSQTQNPSATQMSRPRNAERKSYTPLSTVKSRTNEGRQNMTVETETVSSIPSSALSAGDRSVGGRTDNNGSLRLKPSNETIRPKKERKKHTQKARSINQSTVSSKADIFEARVASAVDEANDSDSEEAFVYESNPPEPQRRPRHHSRTPSVTSAHSVADQQRSGIRSFGDALDDRRVAGKRSMKFSNNAKHHSDSPDSKDGSVRSHQPRHFGRFGRGGSHVSVFDRDSPFTQASKLRSGQLGSPRSRPDSPRSPQSAHHGRASSLFGKKQEPSYDFDADDDNDERTPLVGTVRTPRTARYSRRDSGMYGEGGIDDYYGVRQRSRCSRFGAVVIGLCVLAAVTLSAVGFLVVSNRPMYDVEVRKIHNVLASEQELMLDLLVAAVNPNALGITVNEMDINIFAKSKHVGTSQQSPSPIPRIGRRQSISPAPDSDFGPSDLEWQDLSSHFRPPSTTPTNGHGGVDHGTDPDDDLSRDAQTMLLGRIFHFDQPLTFSGSPFTHTPHLSSGELRLAHPGNKTETGGSARWEKVLQYPFELIVRGVLKYQLPISSRVQSAAVLASVLVHPEEEVDRNGNMRLEDTVGEEEKDVGWTWVEWEELREDGQTS